MLRREKKTLTNIIMNFSCLVRTVCTESIKFKLFFNDIPCHFTLYRIIKRSQLF